MMKKRAPVVTSGGMPNLLANPFNVSVPNLRKNSYQGDISSSKEAYEAWFRSQNPEDYAPPIATNFPSTGNRSAGNEWSGYGGGDWGNNNYSRGRGRGRGRGGGRGSQFGGRQQRGGRGSGNFGGR